MENLPFIVYHGAAWMQDAAEWAERKGWKEKVDYDNLISLRVFEAYLENPKYAGRAFYFVNENLTGHSNF